MNSLLKGFEELPPTVGVLAELCALLRDPYVEVPQISHIIRLDPALATAVLRLSNCAYYGFGTQALDLEEAINRIGVVEVIKLVALIGHHGLSSASVSCYGITNERAWQESLAVAILMEYLAAQTAHEEQGLAYVVGLLHAVGKFPIARRMQRVKPTIVARQGMILTDLARWERDQVGTDYAKVGSELLEFWGFRPEVVDPVAGHLHPFLVSKGKKFACLLHCACKVMPSVLDPELHNVQYVDIPGGILRTAGLSLDVVLGSVEPARAWLMAIDQLMEQDLMTA